MPNATPEQIIMFNDLYLRLHKGFRDATVADAPRRGFTVPQLYVIFELNENPGLTLNELSENIGLSKSTTSNLIHRMEQRGIVKRTIPDENRRVVQLSLDERFVAEHQALLQNNNRIISDLFQFNELSSADAKTVLKALTILLKQL